LQILLKMRRIIGLETGDSLFAPSGAIGNLYALLLARFQRFPDVKSKGCSAIPGELAILTSDQSYFSLKSAANVAGIGIDNCVMVGTDSHGRMIPAELDRTICELKDCGKIPIMVNATSGTTVLGAFDPIEDISNVCIKHSVWLHVDVSGEKKISDWF
jgi:glutamate decarboxylase